MVKCNKKKLRVFRCIQLTVFFIVFVFVILGPSPERVNSYGNFTARVIYLAQFRRFFCIPLCFSCGAGLITPYVIEKKYSPSKKIRVICFICGLVMIGLGVFYCCGFVVFQINPPLTFGMGMYLMQNVWIISIWWSIAAVLLNISISADAVKQ